MLKIKGCRTKFARLIRACYGVTGLAALLLLLGLSSCNKNSSPTGPDLPPATQIASNGSLPRWSPDGQKLAFGGSGSSAGIWIWDSQSGNAIRIVDPTQPHNYDYRWSAGSDQIAFSGAGATIDSTSGLFTVNADGTELTRRHPTGKTPDWLPDGSGLVFAEEDFQSGLQGIFSLAFGTGLTARLTDTGIEPQINSTGSSVAFLDPTPDPSIPHDHLKVVPITGGNITNLADTCYHFVWTTEGANLVYDYSYAPSTFKPSDPGLRICIIAATGGYPTKIVQGGSEPSVSSTGRVAHRQVNGDIGQGLFAIYLDRSNFQQLTLDGAQPCIKPDGSQVAYSNGNGIWVVNP